MYYTMMYSDLGDVKLLYLSKRLKSVLELDGFDWMVNSLKINAQSSVGSDIESERTHLPFRLTLVKMSVL